MIPYWYSQSSGKSTWDSPLLILECMIINGIDNDENTKVIDWESLENSPFIKIKLESEGAKKRKETRVLYFHRNNKRIFKDNPLHLSKPEQPHLKSALNVLDDKNKTNIKAEK